MAARDFQQIKSKVLENIGKRLEARAHALAKKQIAKSGLTNPAIAAALAA